MEGSSTLIIRSDEIEHSRIASEFDRLEAAGREAHSVAASASGTPLFERTIEMRYWGQSFELSVPAPSSSTIDQAWMNELTESFHDAHEMAYGFRAKDEPVELVNLRLTTIGKIVRPQMRKLKSIGTDVFVAFKGERPVYFAENSGEKGVVQTPVYDRSKLPAGAVFEGPAIIEEPDCTTVIHPAWTVTVDEFGNLEIELNS
jgi:N-methylhydantoinase A|tara:strand:- start:278 stop:883 length:606 start_codon:yes stop_codon:yes gene_type:complete